MPIVSIGPNRMRTWQAGNAVDKTGVVDKPTYGLGPTGGMFMPGSIGYDEDLQQRQRAAAATGIAPVQNNAEKLGLYWTGSGVAQGRPLRDIEVEQQQRLNGMGLQNAMFASSLAPSSQPALRSWGIAPVGTDPGSPMGATPATSAPVATPAVSAPSSGLGARIPVADPQALFKEPLAPGSLRPMVIVRAPPVAAGGIMPAAAASVPAVSGSSVPGVLPGGVPLLTNAAQVDQQRANVDAIRVGGSIAPGPGQNWAVLNGGITAPVPAGGLVDAAQQRAAEAAKFADIAQQRENDKVSLLPDDLVKNPTQLAGIRMAMQIDPKGPNADAQYERLGKELNLPGWSNLNRTSTNAQLVKNMLVPTYVDAIRADDARRAGFVTRAGAGGVVPVVQPAASMVPVAPASAGAATVDDVYLNRYLATHPKMANVPRERVRALLQSHLSGGQ